MNKKIIISILVVVSVSISFVGLNAYIFTQSDRLLTIEFSCFTGIKPNAFSAYRTYDNGTHTINMNTCAWIKNTNMLTGSDEYQKINKMSCSELIERNSSGEPYQNKQNRLFAQAKITNCNFVKDYAGT
ncbi:hypothetical protein [Nitrosopumilus sp. Nsub]|uniref:hypothetical protein n=1 Tax=Nitrosopumilus sp. Nsub TaxID=1776294 RepID=UPI000836113B|nr:hypothetical protein [Nitrosopumilus sp. Nsub]